MSPHEPRIPESRPATDPWDEVEQLPPGDAPAGRAHPAPGASSPSSSLPDDGSVPQSVGSSRAVRTGTLGGGGGAGARVGAVEDPVATTAWEEEPPRVPVVRWRLVGSAVLVFVVAVAAWWAVTWLLRPSQPGPVPVDAQSMVEDGTEHSEAEQGAASSGDDGEQAGTSAATDDPAPARGPRETGEPDPPSPSDGADARVRVHVIGQVRSPGVVTVPAEARTADAIAAAGGATRQARPERINLAAPLVDGQQVLVPGEETTEEQLESVQSRAEAVADPTGDRGGDGRGGTEDDATDGPGAAGASAVDLNTADSTALQELPGVGPATAEKIIAHREQVGQFQSLADLDAVSGIGPATLERLAPLVTW